MSDYIAKMDILVGEDCVVIFTSDTVFRVGETTQYKISSQTVQPLTEFYMVHTEWFLSGQSIGSWNQGAGFD